MRALPYHFPAENVTGADPVPSGDDGIDVTDLDKAGVVFRAQAGLTDPTTLDVYVRLPSGDWQLLYREQEALELTNGDGYGPYDVSMYHRFAVRLTAAPWAGTVTRQYTGVRYVDRP
jgi:hypothetical protein